MANTYSNTPVLAKLKIGNEIYWLKDADVRAILDTYKGAVKYDVDTTFAADSENLATSKAIAAYISGEIKDLAGAMHFVGVVEALPEEAKAGDIVILKDTTTEFVYDGSKWVELGTDPLRYSYLLMLLLLHHNKTV